VLLFNTIVTACFFQLLLLNCYIKHSGYFGSFRAAYCVTLIQGPILSGPIVGLKGRAYNSKQRYAGRYSHRNSFPNINYNIMFPSPQY
jgi:hypothetical protein